VILLPAISLNNSLYRLTKQLQINSVPFDVPPAAGNHIIQYFYVLVYPYIDGKSIAIDGPVIPDLVVETWITRKVRAC